MNNKAVLAASRRDLVMFAGEGAESARTLLSDAEYLFADRRWARAYPLAVLASEEWAKAYWMVVLSFMSPQIRASVDLREALGGHSAKMMCALLLPAVHAAKPGVAGRVAAMPNLASVLSSVQREAGKANLAKQRGFYADLLAGGLVSLPSGVTEDAAAEAVARAREVGADAALLHDPEALAALSDVPAEAQPVLDALFMQWAELGSVDDVEAAAAVISDFASRATALEVPTT